MGKVTLCTDKYLDVKPIVALLETEFYDIKLFYKTESIRELKPKYLKYMTMDQQFNIIYSLIKTRETMVKSYFFKIIDLLCIDYAIDFSDYAKYKVCEKTFYFSYDDLMIDIKKTGVHCPHDFETIFLSKEKYDAILEYVSANDGQTQISSIK